jgi:hypothetical protein
VAEVLLASSSAPSGHDLNALEHILDETPAEQTRLNSHLTSENSFLREMTHTARMSPPAASSISDECHSSSHSEKKAYESAPIQADGHERAFPDA